MASSWSTQTATAHWQAGKILSFAECFACSSMERGGSWWGVVGPRTRCTELCFLLPGQEQAPRAGWSGGTSLRLDFGWLLRENRKPTFFSRLKHFKTKPWE